MSGRSLNAESVVCSPYPEIQQPGGILVDCELYCLGQIHCSTLGRKFMDALMPRNGYG